MIVREIVKQEYTEMIFKTFDYFNDFTDTSRFVAHMVREAKTPEDKARYEEILTRLNKGNEEFFKYFNERLKSRS